MVWVLFSERNFLNREWSIEVGCDEDRKYVCKCSPDRIKEELGHFGFVVFREFIRGGPSVFNKVAEGLQSVLPIHLLREQMVEDVGSRWMGRSECDYALLEVRRLLK